MLERTLTGNARHNYKIEVYRHGSDLLVAYRAPADDGGGRFESADFSLVRMRPDKSLVLLFDMEGKGEISSQKARELSQFAEKTVDFYGDLVHEKPVLLSGLSILNTRYCNHAGIRHNRNGQSDVHTISGIAAIIGATDTTLIRFGDVRGYLYEDVQNKFHPIDVVDPGSISMNKPLGTDILPPEDIKYSTFRVGPNNMLTLMTDGVTDMFTVSGDASKTNEARFFELMKQLYDSQDERPVISALDNWHFGDDFAFLCYIRK
jgi:hypothetical protein